MPVTLAATVMEKPQRREKEAIPEEVSFVVIGGRCGGREKGACGGLLCIVHNGDDSPAPVFLSSHALADTTAHATVVVVLQYYSFSQTEMGKRDIKKGLLFSSPLAISRESSFPAFFSPAKKEEKGKGGGERLMSFLRRSRGRDGRGRMKVGRRFNRNPFSIQRNVGDNRTR